MPNFDWPTNPVVMKNHFLTVNRNVLSVGTLGEEDILEETRYWRSRPPIERLIALELLRMRLSNYDSTTTRLQRVFTVTERWHNDLNDLKHLPEE
ncbi:MAG: hypothetical protein IPM36_15520 [Lewinellaceae bacterium]|nr:hypothetical protein [Lewinellaceae bacterium]